MHQAESATSKLPSQISPTTCELPEHYNMIFRVKMSQFAIHNDMSLFHQQKWCLDKIQLTLAIQMNEKGQFFFPFLFFAQYCIYNE